MARGPWSVTAVLLVACGSSGSPSGAGADAGVGGDAGAACDAGSAADGGRRCSLTMPVQGGLTGTLDGETGCGDGSGGAAFLAWDSSALGGRVSAYFESGLPTQPGTYPLSSLTIQSTADGGTQSWTAPSGACTLTVTNVDVECQAVFQQLMQIVYGTGTCTQPAAPESGTTAAPVTIGDFQFVHWL
jgi:hypothetical protein